VTSYDEVIPPGSEGKVSVKVNTARRQGSFSRSVKLETNDPSNSQITLIVQMNIKKEITIRPSDKFSWDANMDEETSKKFFVSSIDPDFLISKVESKNPDFKIQYEKLSENSCDGKSCYEVNITFSPKNAVSRYSEIITIVSNSKKQPKMPLRIYGKIRGSIQYEPESITLLVSSKNPNKSSAEVVLSKAKGNLKILDISSDNPAVKISLKPIEEGKKYTLTVSVDNDLKETKTNWLRGKITVKTAEEKQQAIIIPYTVRKTN
jgi:hypothetical protein